MIFRIEKTKNYTVMANFHLREKSMSLKAKGLLSWMLSNTDDWDYSIEGIVANCKENKTAIRTALQELVDFGYLEIKKLMPESYEDESGNKQVVRSRIEYEYIVHEEPIKNNSVNISIQDIENVSVENHTQRNTKTSNTNKKENNNSSKEELHSQEFQFGKQSKPKKANLYTKCVDMINDFTDNEMIRSDLHDYLYLLMEMRKDGKPFYTNTWKGLLRKLKEISSEPNIQHDSILYSMQKGYIGFYDPKDRNFSSKTTDIRKGKPWEQGVKSETYTEEEKRQIEKERAEREARGEQVWY